ncbi:MAG: tRNA (adenosine(37)-N6)-threonylcarbamoyltransferase complex ATPase subunit type 1 TsaE [Peptococcaceae bacterium]|nr:tRNA (adenosine(37)-N6)-threonylcarbamoyltransferase complex ATPase subunit type 1 TsaE [Peptococcaceae bacterium]
MNIMLPNLLCRDSWETLNASQTYTWGVRLGMFLHPGDLLCLYGDLGAGKTLVAQGIGHALGVKEPITSPTFTMIQLYEGSQIPLAHLIHMDLYRLRDPAEADIIGIWEFIRDDTIVLIEWPQIITDQLPPDRYELHMAGSGEAPREMSLSFLGNRAVRWDQWKNIKGTMIKDKETALEVPDN